MESERKEKIRIYLSDCNFIKQKNNCLNWFKRKVTAQGVFRKISKGPQKLLTYTETKIIVPNVFIASGQEKKITFVHENYMFLKRSHRKKS